MTENNDTMIEVGPPNKRVFIEVKDVGEAVKVIASMDIDAKYGETLTEHSVALLKDIQSKSEKGLSIKQVALFKGVAMGVLVYDRTPHTGGNRNSKYEGVSREIQCVKTTFEPTGEVDEEGNEKTKPVRCTNMVTGTPTELSEKRSLCDTHFEVKAPKKAPTKKASAKKKAIATKKA